MTAAHRSIRLDGFVDLECAAWDRMVVGVLYRPIEGCVVVRDPDELVDALTARGGTWWTWNGGRYDTLQIADTMRARGMRATVHLSGSSVTRLVSGSLSIVDACALIPMPLGRKRGGVDACGAELAGIDPPGELGWSCICGDRCGGYCRIRTGLAGKRLAELTEYCSVDARAGYAAVAAVLTRGLEAGLVMRGTLGGTAWATAQSWIGKGDLPDADWRPQTWREVRRAYYGGRVIVARPVARTSGFRAGSHLDLSSAYPAALATTDVPLGDAVEVGGRRARIAYGRALPGVYVATVDVPEDTWIPPLPMRLPSGGVCYPIGRLTGTWVLPELLEAERRGCRIRAVHEGVVYPDGARPIYAGTVEKWYAERVRSGKASAWGAWWRLLSNALTGKLAEQPERMAVAINPHTVKACVPGKSRANRWGCTREHCTGRCGAYRQLDSAGRVYGIPYYRIGTAAHVHHAAYLTAATRARVLAGIDQVGDDLVYSDTDSIWTVGRAPTPIGDGLGQWEHKHYWLDFEARAAKVYRFVDDHGEVICRVAGMPHLSDADWRRLSVEGARFTSDRGVSTFLEAAPTDRLFRRRYRAGRLPEHTGWYGDRVLRAGSQLTYPVSYEQAQARETGT